MNNYKKILEMRKVVDDIDRVSVNGKTPLRQYIDSIADVVLNTLRSDTYNCKHNFVVVDKIKTAKQVEIYSCVPMNTYGSPESVHKYEAKEVERVILKCTECNEIKIVE